MFPLRRAAGWAILVLAARAADASIPVVELTGVVHAVSAEHVQNAIQAADAQGAPLLVLRLDTPGGLDVSMRQIIDAMLHCKTPVAVFVGPSGARAASAGFFITLAADVAAMAPGTNTGAAHPVAGMGQMDEVMSKKVTSDAAAYLRSKAERRGRNVELAETAVLKSKSFTEKEALAGHLIDLVVPDVPALVRALDGREITRFDGSRVALRLTGEVPVLYPMSWRQVVLSFVADPGILFLLLLGAMAGLGAEISHPGLLFPGIAGALCLVLFLFATQILPVNGAGLVLVLLGLGLFVAEVKVTSHGLLTAGGATAMILGAMMLVDAPIPELRLRPITFVPAVLVLAAWSLFLVRLVTASRKRRATTGRSGMIGETARAETPLSPEGWIVLHGERWRAEADGRVEAGERVQVTDLVGLVVRVRKGV